MQTLYRWIWSEIIFKVEHINAVFTQRNVTIQILARNRVFLLYPCAVRIHRKERWTFENLGFSNLYMRKTFKIFSKNLNIVNFLLKTQRYNVNILSKNVYFFNVEGQYMQRKSLNSVTIYTLRRQYVWMYFNTSGDQIGFDVNG